MNSGESVPPYSEFIVGSQSSVKKEAPLLMHKSSMEVYKKQKSSPKNEKSGAAENRGYMVGTINLKQPRFTYCHLPKPESEKINFIPRKPDSSEMYFSKKRGVFLRKPFDLKKMKTAKPSSLLHLKTVSTNDSLNSPLNVKPKQPLELKESTESLNIEKTMPDIPQIMASTTVNMLKNATLDHDMSPLIKPVIKRKAEARNKFRVSKNGMYTTMLISNNLNMNDLKAETRKRVRQRKFKNL